VEPKQRKKKLIKTEGPSKSYNDPVSAYMSNVQARNAANKIAAKKHKLKRGSQGFFEDTPKDQTNTNSTAQIVAETPNEEAQDDEAPEDRVETIMVEQKEDN
jgi:hypothetical protein